MAIHRDITTDDQVFYDTDRILRYTIYTGNPTAAQILAGEAIAEDVSNWSLAWVVRKKVNSPDPPVIQKLSTGSPADIAIVGVYDVDPLVNTQRVEVTLHDTDTYDPNVSPVVNVKAGTYAYALKRVGDGVETILAYGKFVIPQVAAWE
jgi:hypothetical protein